VFVAAINAHPSLASSIYGLSYVRISLLRYEINYVRKKVYSAGPWLETGRKETRECSTKVEQI
jgi:hypothetical protein